MKTVEKVLDSINALRPDNIEEIEVKFNDGQILTYKFLDNKFIEFFHELSGRHFPENIL